MQCQGLTATLTRCSRAAKYDGYCWQHKQNKPSSEKAEVSLLNLDLSLPNLEAETILDTYDSQKWEAAYQQIMDKKYAKGTRNFSTDITGKPWKGEGEPPIYLIPRQRGGPSYKALNLEGVAAEDIQYCPISKGYSMQDVSSFTLGPIVGEGLCLVNAAFSKCITVQHIEGGGIFTFSRRILWKKAKKPKRQITVLDSSTMLVDGKVENIHKWLKENESLWLEEWSKWRAAIAMNCRGDFHWTDGMQTIAYYNKGEYIDFVTWKKECYIKPSYNLMPSTTVYQFLELVWKKLRVPLGLVHPKAISDKPETPITVEYLTELFNSPTEMCCQPFVVAGLLMGIKV